VIDPSYRSDGDPPGYYPHVDESWVIDPLVPPARGPNFVPMSTRLISGGEVKLIFDGWQLVPSIGEKPGPIEEVNFNIPASSRPMPSPWKAKKKEPEKANQIIRHRNKEYKIDASDGSESDGSPFEKIDF